ncbi:hypothetical protein BGW41_006236 [Actinomortierella wolfii]|nr:hypothetical protein BGW41_006236 [Actinomortierella wolfii]
MMKPASVVEASPLEHPHHPHHHHHHQQHHQQHHSYPQPHHHPHPHPHHHPHHHHDQQPQQQYYRSSSTSTPVLPPITSVHSSLDERRRERSPDYHYENRYYNNGPKSAHQQQESDSYAPRDNNNYRQHDQYPPHSHAPPSPYHRPQSYMNQSQQQQQQQHPRHEVQAQHERTYHQHHDGQGYSYPPHPQQQQPQSYAHSPDTSSQRSPHSNQERYPSYPSPTPAGHAYPQHPPPPQQQQMREYQHEQPRVRAYRDHNDHLVTDYYPGGHDQQRPSRPYPTESRSPSYHPYHDIRAEGPLKYNLPPIMVPDEPFYRKDLPGRHMRYFSKVTPLDYEDSQGNYSSAHNVAPSNTTGNHGDGPSLASLAAMSRQQRSQASRPHPVGHGRRPSMEQARDGKVLPPLYSALPEQRPSAHEPSYDPKSAPSPMTMPPSRSPVSPTQIHHPHPPPPQQQQQQQQPPPQQQQQSSPPQQLKPKAIQPRSIAPAPHSTIAAPPPPALKRKSIVPYPAAELHEPPVKVEARDQQQDGRKRKWTREHSPPRLLAPLYKAPPVPDPDQPQELHLASHRRPTATYDSFPHQNQSSLAAARPPRSASSEVSVKNGQVVLARASPNRVQRYQMTTIRCWHGAIAQKSYGIEKRYLCPPPMVQVNAGLNTQLVKADQPHVTMAVIHEKLNGHAGENLMEQDCQLNDALRCSFRNLHVTGTGSDSSKRFKLELRVFMNGASSIPTAIMDSNPIPIISKPSKKTAKAGNASCFILNGMSVSLLNRINAQTVRTKYMAVDKNNVCAKIGSWSSFTIKMVKPPPAPPVKIVPASMGVFRTASHLTKFVPIRMKGDDSAAGFSGNGTNLMPRPAPGTSPREQQQQQHPAQQGMQPPGGARSSQQAAQQGSSAQRLNTPSSSYQVQQEPVYTFSNSEPVLYGSEIVLINDLTGIATDRLIIRKVENGKVVMNGTGPVSQMQKIVLQHPDRVHPEDGRPYYLSASSIGSPKVEGKIPLQAAMDRSPLLEYRTSSKKASIMDMTDDYDDDETFAEGEDGEMDEEGKRSQMQRRLARSQANVAVDDFVCWTIAGIAKFDYTYFAPIPASADVNVDPAKTPMVVDKPRYNPQSNKLQMKVKNVFEKLTPEEEAALFRKPEDRSSERKLTFSEYVYKRCEDVRQPMRGEEGPIQIWLAQHGPIRMRREQEQPNRQSSGEGPDDQEDEPESEDEEEEQSSSEDNEGDKKKEESQELNAGDQLPRIPTKAEVPLQHYQRQQQAYQQQQQQQQPNGEPQRYYGGSHLPPHMLGQKKRPRKILRRVMGCEAELPYGCEIRATEQINSSDGSKGGLRAELDLLLVERASGVAYRTGYKVVYSKERGSTEWTVEVIG